MFNVGDKIKRIKNFDAHKNFETDKERIYTVKQVMDESFLDDIELEEIPNYFFNSAYFKKVTTFKVGDKVKRITRFHAHPSFAENAEKIYTIKEIRFKDELSLEEITDILFFNYAYFEKVEEPSEESFIVVKTPLKHQFDSEEKAKNYAKELIQQNLGTTYYIAKLCAVSNTKIKYEVTFDSIKYEINTEFENNP